MRQWRSLFDFVGKDRGLASEVFISCGASGEDGAGKAEGLDRAEGAGRWAVRNLVFICLRTQNLIIHLLLGRMNLPVLHFLSEIRSVSLILYGEPAAQCAEGKNRAYKTLSTTWKTHKFSKKKQQIEWFFCVSILL